MGVIMYNGIQYTGAGGGGSDVTPNPEGSATDILKKLEIEDTIYGISNTIELTQAEYDDLPSSKLTDNILYIIKDAAGASGGNNKTLSGTVAPTAALGDNGDEYIQYHLSSNTPVIDAKYTKVRGEWITYQDDSTIVVPVAPAYSAGDHISISQSNEISATYSAFQGTDGTDPGSSGLVPAPAAADANKYLKSDGTWATVAAGGGDVEDVYVNGTSVLDSNKIAQVKSYMELTESQYNALPASKLSDDILYCINDIDYEDRNYLNPIIYSTEEREVGVWTNNKPLYQKTVRLTSFVNGGSTSLGITDIETVVDYTIMAYRGNNDNGWSDNNSVGNEEIVTINSDGGLYYRSSNTHNSLIVTLWYTKTTDTPGSGSYNTLGVPTIHYTTDEQVIGTWIDGKPLYQKTIQVSNKTCDSTGFEIDMGLTNVKKIIDRKITVYINQYSIECILPYLRASTSEEIIPIGYLRSSGVPYLQVKTRGTNYGACSADVTLQYTKTTD